MLTLRMDHPEEKEAEMSHYETRGTKGLRQLFVPFPKAIRIWINNNARFLSGGGFEQM